MKCPHCLHLFHEQFTEISIGLGPEGYWNSLHQKCPGCQKSIIFLRAKDRYGDIQQVFLALPKKVVSRPLPPEVDDAHVIEDYTEAQLVLSDSAKASAALSRRSLQYILREKAGVTKSDLSNEIQEVLDSGKLPSEIAENLDAVRNTGNFAAHPIKSTSTGEIVDVEPHEAEWNLEMLEQLIDFYYVRPAHAKKKRDDLNAKLIAAGKPAIK
jgi:hypothetical protein